METHGNQVLVNAHLLLANLGSDAYVFNVDLDEYLVTDNRTTLPELADGCFGNRTARLVRCACLMVEGRRVRHGVTLATRPCACLPSLSSSAAQLHRVQCV